MRKSKADFLAIHDRRQIIPKRIRDALTALEKEHGAEGWEYDEEFRRRAKLSPPELAEFKEQFKDHQVDVPARGNVRPRTVWVATKKAATDFAKSLQ